MKMLQLFLTGLLAFFSLTGVSFAAEATGVDLTPLTSQISFATVIAAVLGVFALIVGFKLAWKGGQKVLAAINRM